jgi:hypothetical protein
MWFCKSKKVNPEKEAYDAIKAFRDIGEPFNYLGVNCVVTAHDKFIPYVGAIPALQFDYCDKNGIIHSAYCFASEMQAVIKQNE